jgi:light-regulated signal transduction histidine kinase (bacteriophytochrome)
MATVPGQRPAFGTADLSNCELEQIHLPGSIQPHGALLVLDASGLRITRVSENIGRFLAPGQDLLGRPLASADAGLAETVQAALAEDPGDCVPRSLRCQTLNSPGTFDVAVHRVAAGDVVVELEPSVPPAGHADFVERSFQDVLSSLTLQDLCDDTARLFKELTGYDRVMVYRFDPDGHGEVFSERREPGLEPFLGNHYPASDIPQMARRLYERNRIRVLVDIDYEPVPLRPRQAPDGGDLDMSMCALRSVSPIHVQYLKNMGVSATLVVSLMAGGSLWGLISCHHYRPRNPPYEVRAACELIAEVVATRIAALESFARAEADISVRRLEKRIIEAIAREGDWKSALFDNPQVLLQPLQASGAALSIEGQVLSTGEVPGTQQVRALVHWLDGRPGGGLYATAALGLEAPEFAALKPVASGLVSVPISRSPGEYLMWFRPERVRTVTWGGNPFKPVEVGDDPRDLSPRRSFSKWHQLVEGTSHHWSATDLAAAQKIGESIEDVVYQFRAVRMLIAQDQLTQVRRDVREAQQPLVVADASGLLLLVNDAFYRLLPPGHAHLFSLNDLPAVFRDPPLLRDLLQVMLRDHQTWRGEVEIASGEGEIRTLLLRADPVFAPANRVLGFVLFFSDVTHRKTIDAVRRRFQEGIVSSHRETGPHLETRIDLIYRNLLSSVVSNAKLAALEISDGMDLDRVPGMLEAVRDSVARTRSLLRHLLSRHPG